MTRSCPHPPFYLNASRTRSPSPTRPSTTEAPPWKTNGSRLRSSYCSLSPSSLWTNIARPQTIPYLYGTRARQSKESPPSTRGINRALREREAMDRGRGARLDDRLDRPPTRVGAIGKVHEPGRGPTQVPGADPAPRPLLVYATLLSAGLSFGT